MILKFKPSDAVFPTTGGASISQNDGTNLSWDELEFDDSLDESVDFEHKLIDYVSQNVDIHIWFIAKGLTSASYVFRAETRSVSDEGIWDAIGSSSGNVTIVDDSNNLGAGTLYKATISLTNPYTANDRVLQLRIKRLGTDLNDNVSGDAKVVLVTLEY